MIIFIENVGPGSAIRIIVNPETGTGIVRVKIIRNTTGVFIGPTDSNSELVDDRSVNSKESQYGFVDINNLEDGTRYYYACYQYNGTSWIASNAKSIISERTMYTVGEDPYLNIISRVDLGLKGEIKDKTYISSTGEVPVVTIPPDRNFTNFPTVSIKVVSDEAADWSISNVIIPDKYLSPDWEESVGYFGRMVMEIRGWCNNADNRISLRQSLRRIVQSNLPVWGELGLFNITWSQRDSENYNTFNTPVYSTIGSISFYYVISTARIVSQVNNIEIDTVTTYWS